MSRATEVVSLYGETDGANTAGVFTLVSEAYQGGVTEIALGKGLKAKVWAKQISGAPVTVFIDYSPDGGSTWITIDSETLANAGQLNLEKRRPRIVHYRTGRERIRVRWEQPTAGKSAVVLDMEVEEIDSP